MTNTTENEVLNEYRDTVESEGTTLDINIKCYKEPVTKNEKVECHTLVTIHDGQVLYGKMYLPNPIEPEDSAKAIQDIKNNITRFKQ